MISNVFLYKNLRFSGLFNPDLRQYRINLLFSHLIIQIFLHFHAFVLHWPVSRKDSIIRQLSDATRRGGLALVDLAPQTQLQAPQIKIWNTINQWNFCQIWMSSPPHKRNVIGVARGGKGAMPPQIFRKYSHFVLWEAFFQTKYCYSPKIKHLAPQKFLG